MDLFVSFWYIAFLSLLFFFFFFFFTESWTMVPTSFTVGLGPGTPVVVLLCKY